MDELVEAQSRHAVAYTRCRTSSGRHKQACSGAPKKPCRRPLGFGQPDGGNLGRRRATKGDPNTVLLARRPGGAAAPASATSGLNTSSTVRGASAAGSECFSSLRFERGLAPLAGRVTRLSHSADSAGRHSPEDCQPRERRAGRLTVALCPLQPQELTPRRVSFYDTCSVCSSYVLDAGRAPSTRPDSRLTTVRCRRHVTSPSPPPRLHRGPPRRPRTAAGPPCSDRWRSEQHLSCPIPRSPNARFWRRYRAPDRATAAGLEPRRRGRRAAQRWRVGGPCPPGRAR